MTRGKHSRRSELRSEQKESEQIAQLTEELRVAKKELLELRKQAALIPHKDEVIASLQAQVEAGTSRRLEEMLAEVRAVNEAAYSDIDWLMSVLFECEAILDASDEPSLSIADWKQIERIKKERGIERDIDVPMSRRGRRMLSSVKRINRVKAISAKGKDTAALMQECNTLAERRGVETPYPVLAAKEEA